MNELTDFQFAVCLNNNGYEASLELGKIYRLLPDEQAKSLGYVRIVDESGTDYAYSDDRFFPIYIPEQVSTALLAAYP